MSLTSREPMTDDELAQWAVVGMARPLVAGETDPDIAQRAAGGCYFLS